MSDAWLSVVGIGEGGLDDLPPEARALVARAELLVGGERHLAMIPDDGRPRLAWGQPFGKRIDDILARRGRPVCVLATGDPMNYGIGGILARRVPAVEMRVLPAPSAFSLACARMGWAMAEVEMLTVHGRPLALLNRHIHPGARLIVLADGGDTPAQVAATLAGCGFGASRLSVLEHMGGPRERRIDGTAANWTAPDVAAFNTVAVECVAGPEARYLPLAAGLPDDAFEHDGQITKREVRAVTLSALGPLPGELLWDVGAGCGSIAIEWMRAHRRCRAIAIEARPARCRLAQWNAGVLGVPDLRVVRGEASAALADLPVPDAVFVGGGVTAPGVLDACWAALRPGGRLVANAVTLEGERELGLRRQRHGGDLVRLSVERADAIGDFTGWAPLRPVTQWRSVKP